MADFISFSKAVKNVLDDMLRNGTKAFISAAPKDELWDTYLNSFPEGTNNIYIKNREYDCSCCRSFIKNVGGLLFITETLELKSLWDLCEGQLNYPFTEIAKALSVKSKAHGIESLFISPQPSYGQMTSRSMIGDKLQVFNHFYTGALPSAYYSNSPGEKIGKYEANRVVFAGGLALISDEALSDVKGMISDNSLYRGQEKKRIVEEFINLKNVWNTIDAEKRKLFEWKNADAFGAGLKNDVIGTLLVELSEGKELDAALSAYGHKVNPFNYRHSSSAVSTTMVRKAVDKLKELGYESALKRRLANRDDISLKDILWTSANAASVKKGDLAELLLSDAQKKPTRASLNEGVGITAADFMTNVAPKAKKISVHVDPKHLINFVTLTTAVNANAKNILAWDNPFAWSYSGNTTDAVAQRVKAAGGNIDADLRVSLSWYNADDLDLHCVDPRDKHIYFGNKCGILDVDMNAFSVSEDPVENMAWVDPQQGKYKFAVNKFTHRNTSRKGFQIDVVTRTQKMSFKSNDAQSGIRTAFSHKIPEELTFVYEDGLVKSVNTKWEPAESSTRSVKKWNISTGDFAEVSEIMLSPNYWGGEQKGNLHWMFILKDCKVDSEIRGLYNEFLTTELNDIRKVFQNIGEKFKCEPTDLQLSGLGFSSTVANTLLARVESESGTKNYSIQF